MKLVKKIEIFLKKIIEKIIVENRNTYDFTEVKNIFFFNKKPKILLLRHDKIGDLIISTPFIRILRENLNNAQIDILLSKSNVSAKKCVEKYINKYWIYDKKLSNILSLIKKIRAEKYDLVVDLFDNASTTSAFLIKYAKPTFALGINKKNSKIYDYTVPMLDRFSSHIVERVANLLIVFGINPAKQNLDIEYDLTAKTNKNINPAKNNIANGVKSIALNINTSKNPAKNNIANGVQSIALNINTSKNPAKNNIADGVQSIALNINTSKNPAKNNIDKKYYIGINLSGGSSSRYWGYENNFRLIEYIKNNYSESEIRVFSTEKYAEIANKLKSKFIDINSNKCNNFDDFAIEVSKCNFIISPDTSIVHLASAFKIPSIIFYIRKPDMSHSPWYPYRVSYIALETAEDNLAVIPFENVKIALEKMLSEIFLDS